MITGILTDKFQLSVDMFDVKQYTKYVAGKLLKLTV